MGRKVYQKTFDIAYVKSEHTRETAKVQSLQLLRLATLVVNENASRGNACPIRNNFGVGRAGNVRIVVHCDRKLGSSVHRTPPVNAFTPNVKYARFFLFEFHLYAFYLILTTKRIWEYNYEGNIV